MDKPVCEELSECSISYGLIAWAVVIDFFKSHSKQNIIFVTPYEIASEVFEELWNHFKVKIECLSVEILINHPLKDRTVSKGSLAILIC